MKRENLTKGQLFALEEMLSGKNVFLTGEAGTGKSEVIKMFIADRIWRTCWGDCEFQTREKEGGSPSGNRYHCD